jgi:hypothetical protein
MARQHRERRVGWSRSDILWCEWRAHWVAMSGALVAIAAARETVDRARGAIVFFE